MSTTATLHPAVLAQREAISRAADFLRSKGIGKPSVAIILGSGLGPLADEVEQAINEYGKGQQEIAVRYRDALAASLAGRGEHELFPCDPALADTAAYYLVLAACGPLALAVTSSLDIHFLARPRPGTIVATAELLKRGRRLVVADRRHGDLAHRQPAVGAGHRYRRIVERNDSNGYGRSVTAAAGVTGPVDERIRA